MAGRHLKELFRAFRARDELAFRRAGQAIVDEEQAKQHHALARDLLKLLVAGGNATDAATQLVLPAPPTDREGEWPLGEVRTGEWMLEDLVLAPEVATSLRGLITEVARWPELDAAGIPRRQRVLLEGPPGCGKTTAAEAVATELGRPLLLVRLDAVVSSYLGETASNLRRILDYASQAPFVVLFDEFDALGRSRDDAAEHGEMKRVVTAFLQMIDNYRGPSVLLTATNHPGLLDAALWRRFGEVLRFRLPTVHQLRVLLRLRLRAVPHRAVPIEATATALKGLPHAAVDRFVANARRAALIDGRRELTDHDVKGALAAVTHRPW